MIVMQNGDQIAGGGISVIHITKAQYDANPSAYDSPDVLVHITDAPSTLMGANSVGYGDTNMKFVGDIATKSVAEKIEFSDTAIYAHAVGDYFINKDGEYCKCISAVQVGQTLTKNTNYVVTDVGSEIKEINAELIAKVNVNTAWQSADLNSLGTGIYFISTPTNGPSNESWGVLICFYNGSDTAFQMFTPSSTEIYYRQMISGSWTNWRKVLYG